MHTEPDGGAGRTEDAEACAVWDGHVYTLGSQFGKKAGPLSARRSWIARVSEASLEQALDGGRAQLEIARLRFGLHRAVNDALAAAQVELLPLGPLAREAYIDATIALGAEGRQALGRAASRSADQPINVEAAEFRADGRLLLGLRYPVTADGHPLLVEIHDVESLFDDPDALPRAGNVWWLENVGSAGGARRLPRPRHARRRPLRRDRRRPRRGQQVRDRARGPPGGRPRGVRARPLLAPGRRGRRAGRPRRPCTTSARSAASRASTIDHEGHAHYVIDEEGHVALRTLIVE